MSWTYEQLTGRLLHDGKVIGKGYAGHGAGLNNPAMQNVQGVGPLPRGGYTIGKVYDHPHLGRCVMNLEPVAGNQMFGRSLFRLHGDNAAANHTASDGCIIQNFDVRSVVSISNDRSLTVV